MIETPTLQSEREDAPAEVAPPSLRELLPRGARLNAVTVVGLLLAAASLVVFGLTGHAVLGVVLCPLLVLLAVIDFEHHLLPNDLVFPGVLAVGLIVAAANPGGFLTHLAAGAALAAFFLVFVIGSRGNGLGMGDVKLGFLIGLALGWQTVSAALVALGALLLAALWILFREGLESRRKAIPFGPFLAFGAILTYFLT